MCLSFLILICTLRGIRNQLKKSTEGECRDMKPTAKKIILVLLRRWRISILIIKSFDYYLKLSHFILNIVRFLRIEYETNFEPIVYRSDDISMLEREGERRRRRGEGGERRRQKREREWERIDREQDRETVKDGETQSERETGTGSEKIIEREVDQ